MVVGRSMATSRGCRRRLASALLATGQDASQARAMPYGATSVVGILLHAKKHGELLGSLYARQPPYGSCRPGRGCEFDGRIPHPITVIIPSLAGILLHI